MVKSGTIRLNPAETLNDHMTKVFSNAAAHGI